MNNEIIQSIIAEFRSSIIGTNDAVRRLMLSEIAPPKDLAKEFFKVYTQVRSLDWHYQYTDDGQAYRRAEREWKLANEQAESDDMFRLAMAIASTVVSGSQECPLIRKAAGWESTPDTFVLDGLSIDRRDCAMVGYGVGYMHRYAYVSEVGDVTIIDPPKITKQMVIDAASSGIPVVKWHDWAYASAYADSEEFYGWRLLVRPYNRELSRGAIFVVPTITDTRRIHRAGKIKHIAQITGQPLIWAKSYYSRSKKVKYAIEDRVVEKVANYSGSTYEEWQKLPEDNSRARAVKKMVALINQFEGA